MLTNLTSIKAQLITNFPAWVSKQSGLLMHEDGRARTCEDMATEIDAPVAKVEKAMAAFNKLGFVVIGRNAFETQYFINPAVDWGVKSNATLQAMFNSPEDRPL